MTEKVGFEDVEEEETAAKDRLQRLSALSNRMKALELEMLEHDTKLQVLAKEYAGIAETDIPAILDETGVSELRLSDGTKVVLTEKLRVSTTGKYRGIINEWLVETGNADLIKDEFTVPFGRGDGAHSKVLEAFLTSLGMVHARKRFVASASFAALLRDMQKNEEDVPLDKLGVHVDRRAKLKE